jgi:hypothetical protein
MPIKKARSLSKKVRSSGTKKNKTEKTRSGSLKRGGVTFAGFNKPRSTPEHKNKSHAVLAKEGEKVKLIRFGEKKIKTTKPNIFTKRSSKDITRGKLSPAFWENTNWKKKSK